MTHLVVDSSVSTCREVISEFTDASELTDKNSVLPWEEAADSWNLLIESESLPRV